MSKSRHLLPKDDADALTTYSSTASQRRSATSLALENGKKAQRSSWHSGGKADVEFGRESAGTLSKVESAESETSSNEPVAPLETSIKAAKAASRPSITPETSPQRPGAPLVQPAPSKGKKVARIEAYKVSTLSALSRSIMPGPAKAKRTSPRGEFQNAIEPLPLYSYTNSNSSRKVIYTKQTKKSEASAERLLELKPPVVGFDLEWKPMQTGVNYNRVSLVQIAAEDEIHLVQLNGTFPPTLKTFLEDPTVLKVGAGIEQDAKKLFDDWQVTLRNYLDLSHLARCLDPFWNDCDMQGSMVLKGAFGWETDPYDDVSSDEEGGKLPITPTSPKDAGLLPASSRSNSSSASPVLSFSSQRSVSSASKGTPPSSPPAPYAYPPTPTSNGSSHSLVEFPVILPHIGAEMIQIYGAGLPIALVRLVARYLGRKMDKTCQLSNWAAPLNKKQIEYAANDGCAGLDVYNTLMKVQTRRLSIGNVRGKLSRHVTAPALSSMGRTNSSPSAYIHKAQSTPLLHSAAGISSASVAIEALKNAVQAARISQVIKEQAEDNAHYPSPPVTPNLPHGQPSDPSVVPSGIPQPMSVSQAFPLSIQQHHRGSLSVDHMRFSVASPSQGIPFPSTVPRSGFPFPPPGLNPPFGLESHFLPGATANALNPPFISADGPPMSMQGPMPFSNPSNYFAPFPPFQPLPGQGQWYGAPMNGSIDRFGSHRLLPQQSQNKPSTSYFPQPTLPQPSGQVHPARPSISSQSATKKDGAEWVGDGWIPTPISSEVHRRQSSFSHTRPA